MHVHVCDQKGIMIVVSIFTNVAGSTLHFLLSHLCVLITMIGYRCHYTFPMDRTQWHVQYTKDV